MRFLQVSGTRGPREPGPCRPAMMGRRVSPRRAAESTRNRARARSDIRAGNQRVPRQMALRMRRKSTCLRTTSNGSVTLMTAESHVTELAVQDASSMRTLRALTCWAIWQATGPVPRLFPRSGPPPAPWAASRAPACSPRRIYRHSALAEPAERRLGPGGHRFRRRLVLAVAPRAAWAVLVVALPAWNADHAPYCAA